MTYFETIAHRFPVVVYPRGHVIVGQDDVGGSVWYIERGLVKVSVFSADGDERIFDLLGAGGVFGEPGLFGGMIGATVTALQDVTCLAIPVAAARGLVAEDHEFALAVLHALTRKLRRRGRQLADAAFGNAVRQVAGALVYLADDRRRGCQNSVRTTQGELAHLLGLSRVTVATALARLERDGIVVRQNREVVLVDPGGLQQVATDIADGPPDRVRGRRKTDASRRPASRRPAPSR